MKLSINNVKKQFKNSYALADVSFIVGQGEFVCVIGSSGAGKTTLFRILNGEMNADSGRIFVDETELTHCSKREKRILQKQIGTIYQDFCLVEPSTVLQNVLLGSLPEMGFFSGVAGAFGRKRRDEAAALLTRVGLADKLEEPVRNLSGGQKQRVAIARTLMQHAQLILADEPVSSLDPVIGQGIVALLKELQTEQGLTVLMNSHNLELAQGYSDRIIGLNSGCVVYDGQPGEMNEQILHQIYADKRL